MKKEICRSKKQEVILLLQSQLKTSSHSEDAELAKYLFSDVTVQQQTVLQKQGESFVASNSVMKLPPTTQFKLQNI